jgi:oligoribonuclease NrnB/cAMP/cGMP phosphodiesterase (DHH superfamily)
MSEPKIKIFTHSEDCDGLFSAFFASRYIQEVHNRDYEVVPLNYSQTDQIPANGFYFITDLNLKPGHPALKNEECVIWDHHVWQEAPASNCAIIDSTRCAAQIAIDECVRGARLTLGQAYYNMREALGAADLFQTENPWFKVGRSLNQIISLIGFNALWDVAKDEAGVVINSDKTLDSSLSKYIPIIEAQQLVAERVAKVTLVDNPGFRGCELGFTLCVNCGGDRSQIGADLVKKHGKPSIQLLVIAEGGIVRHQLAIRSTNGEAREIALKLGGGGHPNAAGVNFPANPFWESSCNPIDTLNADILTKLSGVWG